MKFMLIALNVILACAVGYLAWSFVSDTEESSMPDQVAPHTRTDKKKTATATVAPAQKAVQESPAVTEDKINALVQRNIFNTQRVPDAPANRNNRTAQQQIRADMRLVGTFTVGDSIGAIILQRLQGNSQQQLRALQQQEYEKTMAASRVTDPKKKATGDEKADGQAEAGDAVATDASVAEKKAFVAGNAAISANNVFRQFLKIGDTTVTGYKLVEVTKTSAVLTKNSERIELTLLQPSEASNFARQQNNNNRNNNNNNRNNNNNNDNNNNNNRNQQANNNNNNRNNNGNNNRNNNNNNRNQQNNNRNNNNNRNR